MVLLEMVINMVHLMKKWFWVKVLYLKALDHDSTYAKAYSGLAFLNLHYYQFVTNLSEEVYLDSALIFADIALAFDHQEADAYVVKGYYFWFNNRFFQAIEQFDKAFDILLCASSWKKAKRSAGNGRNAGRSTSSNTLPTCWRVVPWMRLSAMQVSQCSR